MSGTEPPCCIGRVWPALIAAAHGGCRPPAPAEPDLPELDRRLYELYRDFLEPAGDGLKVIAHLGQSLDGRIATTSGHSSHVTCHSNMVHMHRLRALADAVLVGGGTVAHDDPQLTVRHVPGPSPTRVVIDTERRLAAGQRVFQEVPPRTLLLCRRDRLNGAQLGRARIMPVEARDGRLHPADILAALRAQGLRRIFIEGGGITVSRFLESGCLDRLQLCIAPVIIGSGRDALRLSPIATMDQALRLEPEVLPMGSDWLFTCRLERRPLADGRSARKPEQVLMADATASATILDGRLPERQPLL